MATTVGPARDKADNSADRGLIADSVWLPVRRFHVGTNPQRFTSDAGYTTATDSRVDNPTAFSCSLGGVHIRQVSHLARLVNDLMDASRVSSGRVHLQLANVAVSSIVERAVDTVRHLIDQ